MTTLHGKQENNGILSFFMEVMGIWNGLTGLITPGCTKEKQWFNREKHKNCDHKGKKE